MRQAIWLLPLGLLAGLALAARSDDPPLPAVKSTAQKGQELPGPFRCYNVTGPRAGKYHCPVNAVGLDPAVAVFAREVPAADKPLAQLLQKLDAAVGKYKGERFRAYAVFLTLDKDLTEDEKFEEPIAKVKALADAAKLTQVVLCLAPVKSPEQQAYALKETDAVTVLIYDRLTVKDRLTFTADKALDAEAIDKIVADVDKLVAPHKQP